MNELKNYRLKLGITQTEAAKILLVSLRTYQRYENDSYLSNKEIEKMTYLLSKETLIDEEHGILNIDFIKKQLNPILNHYDINLCYLFGSYARNEARENSDVDLLVDTNIKGLNFLGIVEEIRVALGKKIDLLRLNDFTDKSSEILKNILKEGIKIK